MKLCKDCKWSDPREVQFLWFRPMKVYDSYTKCRHESGIDPVNGNGKRFCGLSREYGPCGDGKYWEAA